MRRALLLGLAALGVGLLLKSGGWLSGSAAPPPPAPRPLQQASLASPARGQLLKGTVVRVLDGRTIEARVDGRVETVRYVGVELHGDRREAAAFNRQFVNGQPVELETDMPDRDASGRLLAYVYVGDVMVNAELVAQGHARVVHAPPPLRHHGLLLRLERQASLLRLS